MKKNLKKNYVMLGNSLDVMRSIPTDSCDHCITDPPYNISGNESRKKIGWIESNPTWTEQKKFSKIDEEWDKFGEMEYADFTKSWLAEVNRIVKPNGNLLIFGSYHNIYRIGIALEDLKLKVNNSIIWYKRNAFPNITRRMLCESTEQIIWAVNENRKDARNWTFNYDELKAMTENGKQMRNMWDIPMTPTSERKSGKHPSQKPLRLSERLILGFTEPGSLILDPFAGSGSFLVAAATCGRDYLGIEREREFVDLAKRRIKVALSTVQLQLE